MKAKLVALSIAAVALAMTGCSNDENEEMDNWNGEIRLSSGVAVQTRANTQAEQIQSGETVYAWVDKATTGESYINAWTLTAQGNGSFTGSSKYYPTDGSTLDFYAMHGNFVSSTFTENETEFPEFIFIHSVTDDQSGAENYAKSDLLYAVTKGVTRSSSAVNLEFYHMLSKVEVALKSGDGKPDLTGATVTIEGTKLNAGFFARKDKNISDRYDRANMIVAEGSPTPIKIRTAITEDNFGTNTQYAEAVLVSGQKWEKNAIFIKVELQNGATFSYKIDGPLELESGMKYTYKITVNQSGLSVSSEIKNWDTAPDKEGEATMD